jgi:hypothetical protein
VLDLALPLHLTGHAVCAPGAGMPPVCCGWAGISAAVACSGSSGMFEDRARGDIHASSNDVCDVHDPYGKLGAGHGDSSMVLVGNVGGGTQSPSMSFCPDSCCSLWLLPASALCLKSAAGGSHV